MADLLTPENVLRTFFRLLNISEDDDALTENGEATNDVAFQYLNRGVRAGQRYLLSVGYVGWRRLSPAITWVVQPIRSSLVADTPEDFLRAYGNIRRSALMTPDGSPWGRQIQVRDGDMRGNFYYIRGGSLGTGDTIWLTRGATPPSCLYLDYHYRHPEWSDEVEIDFPLEARGLIPAMAAELAMEESWLPGDRAQELKISRAVEKAKGEAREVGRPTKQARRMRMTRVYGTRWAWAALVAGAAISLASANVGACTALPASGGGDVGVAQRVFMPLRAVRPGGRDGLDWLAAGKLGSALPSTNTVACSAVSPASIQPNIIRRELVPALAVGFGRPRVRPFSSALSDASARVALAITFGSDVKIVGSVRMAPFATRFAGVAGGGAFSSENILAVRDRLQVIGVDAMSDSTEVVGDHSFGERAPQEFVDSAVNPSVSRLLRCRPLLDRVPGVPVTVTPAAPLPAASLGIDVDSLRESLGQPINHSAQFPLCEVADCQFHDCCLRHTKPLGEFSHEVKTIGTQSKTGGVFLHRGNVMLHALQIKVVSL